MQRCLFHALGVLLCATALSCGNEFFTVADTDAGPEGDCVPHSGFGTLCVRVSTTGTRPAYDSATLQSLSIDGKGVIYIYLFDEDPAATNVRPKITLQYPPRAGNEVDVNALPATVSGVTQPGVYWFITAFQDAPVSARPSQESIVAGDLVSLPVVDLNRKVQYPQVNLTENTLQRIEVKVSPMRRLDLTVRSALGPQAGVVVHGDGPMSFLIYDGAIEAGGANILAALSSPCVNVKPLNPVDVKISLATHVVGNHKLFASLYDYQLPTSDKPLPPGTLYSALAGTSVSIDEKNWASNVRVSLENVTPNNDVANDPNVCP
jgi:hypothetical protein